MTVQLSALLLHAASQRWLLAWEVLVPCYDRARPVLQRGCEVQRDL